MLVDFLLNNKPILAILHRAVGTFDDRELLFVGVDEQQ